MVYVKIGEYEIADTDKKCANKIVTEFLEQEVEIIKGELPSSGRSRKNNKHFVLKTDIQQNVGIKIPFNERSDLDVELVVKEVRDTQNLFGYKIEKISGFPMDGDEWRNGCLLISDWGKEGIRINLRELNQSQVSAYGSEFLNQLAVNSAISCFLGVWDREPRNFVWDTIEKKIISIDHEKFYSKPWDLELCEHLASCVKKFFGDLWYDQQNLQREFSEEFNSTWEILANNISAITEIYKKYNFSTRSSLLQLRINKGADFFLGNIML